jgi:DNA repair/transcription protein MET18/MMS19
VRALGSFLVSETDSVRTRGLEYLANVVAAVDRAQINRPAAATLRGFFMSKLDDTGALPHALRALMVLARLTSFGDEEAEEVYRAWVVF